MLSATGVIAEADFDPRLRTLLENIIPEHGTMDDYVVEHDFPHVGKRVLLLIQSVLTVEGRKAEKHQAAFDNGLLQIEAPSASIESSQITRMRSWPSGPLRSRVGNTQGQPPSMYCQPPTSSTVSGVAVLKVEAVI